MGHDYLVSSILGGVQTKGDDHAGKHDDDGVHDVADCDMRYGGMETGCGVSVGRARAHSRFMSTSWTVMDVDY
jgi:hypothetical protein